MAQEIVDLIVVVDDESSEMKTVKIAESLPNTVVHVHDRNRGYGANQKSAIKLPLNRVGILSLWFTRIISTPPCLFRPWLP